MGEIGLDVASVRREANGEGALPGPQGAEHRPVRLGGASEA